MDLEMTGLDPATEVIVEIATLITDDELNVIAEGPDLVISQPEAVLVAMDPFVVEMHTSSGLLTAIRQSTITLDQAGTQTLEFIKNMFLNHAQFRCAETRLALIADSWLNICLKLKIICTIEASMFRQLKNL